MTFRVVSLGFSSLQGKRGVDQAFSFRKQLRSLLPYPEGVSVLVCPCGQGCEVRVAFEDAEEAKEWVRNAVELSPEVWQAMQDRRRERA